jgi:HEAT repeat protein
VTPLSYLIDELICGDDVRVEQASNALVRRGADAVPLLLHVIRSSSPDHRWWALHSLARIHHAQADQTLVNALGDPDISVCQAAALSLRQRPLAAALPRLISLLGSEDGLLSRLAGDALAALGAVGTPALAQAATDPSPARRIAAVRALALNEDPAAIPALYVALEDTSGMVEHWAVEGLERRGLGMVYFPP